MKEQDKPKVSRFNSSQISIPRQELTFAVTEECNLNCTYCYLPRKNSGEKMSFDVARKAVDYFLSNPEHFSAPRLHLDFIGGEPLLAMDVVDAVVDYFKFEAYRLDHRWFSNYKVLLTTNGTLYHSEKAQRFVNKNKNCLAPSISLDGVEAKHNNARKYYNGKGSYNDVLKNSKLMLEQFPYSTIKATFGQGDIKYYKDSIIHFIELGYPLRSIFANVIYEDFDGQGDDLVFERQLVELADYLIDNDLCSSDDYISIFSEHIGTPYTVEHLSKHWCNAGHGVIVATDGSFYPCIRFLEMAFDQNGLARKIGDVDNGMDFDKLRPFRVLTLKNCSPPECLECPVASGCGMCSGHALAESDLDTIFHRPVHICKMHKARVRGNRYFWEKLDRKERKEKNAFHMYQRQIKFVNKKILNVLVSNNSPSICSYETGNTDGNRETEILDPDTLRKYLRIAKQENVLVNLIHTGEDDVNGAYRAIAAEDIYQVTRPYNGENSRFKLQDGMVFIFETGQEISPGFSCANVILHARKEDLNALTGYVETLFSHGVLRINLVFDDLDSWDPDDFNRYEDVLDRLSKLLAGFFRENRQKSLSVLTDRLLLDKMNNCNAGEDHITLGPDGKLYLCPAFYYSGQPLDAGTGEIADNELNISTKLSGLLKLENAPICANCDAYQCRRCVYLNKEQTGELTVPGEKQCIIAHIEREAGRLLQEQLVEENILPFPNLNLIPQLNYADPFVVSKVW